MSVRTDIAATPEWTGPAEATDESYAGAVQYLAKHMLRALDTRPSDWAPESDSASGLGDMLYAEIRDDLPEEFRDELSGGQVMMAAHLAYRAWKGD